MSTPADHLPLAGLLVLDFSQFLAGPSATLRMADMGATVIKVERPVTGDLCRQLYISDLEIDGDSTLFHTINRTKRSYAADLKGRSDDREFSPRRDGAHRPVLRGSAHAESAHHLWQRYRLWPHRPMD